MENAETVVLVVTYHAIVRYLERTASFKPVAEKIRAVYDPDDDRDFVDHLCRFEEGRKMVEGVRRILSGPTLKKYIEVVGDNGVFPCDGGKVVVQGGTVVTFVRRYTNNSENLPHSRYPQ